MEGSPIKPIIKEELNNTEQNVEQFSLSEQEKNIREIFKFNPDLLKEVQQEVGEDSDYKDITIELGRNKDVENLGKVQNIKVYYKGELIINSDEETTSDKLYLVAKEDGISYVGNVFIPTELQGKGLGSKILQKVSDTLDTKIVPSYLVGDHFTSENAKKMWNKIGNEILPNHEAEKLYAKYLETIFPESKVKDIVWHGTRGDWYKTEQFNTNLGGTSSNNKENTDGIYFIKYKQAASAFGDKKTIFPAIIDIKNPNIIPLTEFNKSWTSKEKYSQMKSGDGIIAEQEKSPEEYYREALDKYNEAQKDEDEMSRSFFRKPDGPEDFHEEQLSTTYVVYDPSQIHILGSKYDIEQFKEFVSKSESKKDRQSIQEFLKESGIEKVPNIETHFFFNSHATAEDGQMVADRLDDKDIFIQENAGWDKERLETWHKISSGEFTPEQAIENEKGRGKAFFWPDYFKAIFEKLQGTNKEVLLVDIKSDSEIYNEIYDLMRKDGIYWNILDRSKSFEENCERIADVSELESITQKERENEILNNMKTSLLELLKEKPELQGKENLKILFSMGAFHTRLYHEMKKSGDNVSREIPSSSYTFNPRMAVERIIHFKGSEKAKEYMPKILLSFLLQRLNMKYDDISQKVLSRFSDEQTHEFFEMYKKSESDDQFRNEAQPWIVEQFKKK